MKTAAVLSFLVVLVQLSDSYLRYLSFRSQTEPPARRALWRRLGALGAAAFCLYAAMFYATGIDTLVYKATLMLGWAPYLAVFMRVLPGRALQHLFVFGMAALWSFTEQNLGSIVAAAFVSDVSEPAFLLVHASLYALFFLLLLPPASRFFVGLLPAPELFAMRPQGLYIALMPVIVMSGPLLLLADRRISYPWEERLARLFLPFVFLFIYRYALAVANRFHEYQRSLAQTERMREQLSFLEDYNRVMQENQQRMAVLRHDIRHHFRILYMMLRDGEAARAKEYIRTQELLLDAASTPLLCKSPLLNTAVSIHLWRAEEMGVLIRQELRLPERFATDENDLSALLSSLLECAVAEEARQEPGRRELSLTLRHDGRQFILALANRLDAPVPLAEDGLPAASEEETDASGRMLRFFLKKYDAYADFSQEDGWARLYMYWEDRVSC